MIGDGTLSTADRAILAAQLGGPGTVPIGAIDTAPAPKGGT